MSSPLVGQHVSQACTACHLGSVYVGTPRECIGCHKQSYRSALNPNHLAAGFCTACEPCHTATDSSWDLGRYPHSTWPLQGAHVAPDCTTCHSHNVYAGMGAACATSTGTTAPTVTMGAGSDAGHRTRIFAGRGAVAEGDPTDVLGARFKGPSEETDVGPIPGVSGLTPGALVFVIGFGNDNWTDSEGVVATLTGDGLTWAEAEDYIVSVSGMADQGGVVAYAQAPAGGSVTSKTFSVANLYVFTSMGRMWAIRPGPARPSDFMPFFGL